MTPIDAQRRLRELTSLSPTNFEELVFSSKEIIDCWIDAGFAYPSTFVEEFVSIDSQADDLRSSSDVSEKQGFYESFCAVYKDELQALKKFLDRSRR